VENFRKTTADLNMTWALMGPENKPVSASKAETDSIG
jgi:hypothetical protein